MDETSNFSKVNPKSSLGLWVVDGDQAEKNEEYHSVMEKQCCSQKS